MCPTTVFYNWLGLFFPPKKSHLTFSPRCFICHLSNLPPFPHTTTFARQMKYFFNPTRSSLHLSFFCHLQVLFKTFTLRNADHGELQCTFLSSPNNVFTATLFPIKWPPRANGISTDCSLQDYRVGSGIVPVNAPLFRSRQFGTLSTLSISHLDFPPISNGENRAL